MACPAARWDWRSGGRIFGGGLTCLVLGGVGRIFGGGLTCLVLSGGGRIFGGGLTCWIGGGGAEFSVAARCSVEPRF